MASQASHNQAHDIGGPLIGAPAVPDQPEPAPDTEVASQTGITLVADEPTTAGGASGLAWNPEDYGPAVTGSAAEQLSSSGIAPAIAAARGYESLSGDHTAVRDRIGIDMRTAAGKQLKKAAMDGDALLVPGYRLEDVYRHRRDETHPPAFWQLRPHAARVEHDPLTGRPRKYVVLSGSANLLGLHPAMPASWIHDYAALFITDGHLKADAVLTALLRHLGATEDLLRSKPAGLTAFMEGVPEVARVLVASFPGAGSFNAPEWDSIALRGRAVWLAFDDDAAESKGAWEEAKRTFSKVTRNGGVPMLVAGAGSSSLEDYLARGYTWSDLESLLTPTLPPRPTAKEPSPGDWRINEDLRRTEELQVGHSGVPGWEPVVELAGRLIALKRRRSVTDEEMRAGVLDDQASRQADGTVEIEVSWSESDKTVQKGRVHGPSDLLAESPSQWHKTGHVDSAVAAHPDWPPSPKWMTALKSHRREDLQISTLWDHMGWVPTVTGAPVFIVGDQVIGPNGEMAKGVREAEPGVDEEILAGARNFGVTVPGDPEEAIYAVETMFDSYLAAWGDQRIAAIVLAAALRPVVPLPSRAPMLLTGARGTGKSWTASAIMGFWQARPGVWRPSSLPGAASDTGYSTENALAHAPIWVSDDLAPSSDRRQAVAAEAKITDLVRAVHNGSAKRRMYVDGTAREVLAPRAVFVVTAENELSVGSAMDRVVHVRFSRDTLTVGVSAVDRLRDQTDVLPTITGFVISSLAARGATSGWTTEMVLWEGRRRELIESARTALGGSGGATRHATIAADTALGLVALEEALGAARSFFPGRVDSILERLGVMKRDVASFVGESYSRQQLTTPGQNLLQALASVLRAGHAHIVDPGSGGVPILDTDTAVGNPPAVNQLLGWRLPAEPGGHAIPGGLAIGRLVRSRNSSELYILFDLQVAFDVAKRFNPSLIPPGSYSRTSWESMWSERMPSGATIAGGPWSRNKFGGDERPYVAVRKDGVDLFGIPVLLTHVLNP